MCGAQNLCTGTGPCGLPHGLPTTLVLGDRQKAVHPQLCGLPRGLQRGLPRGLRVASRVASRVADRVASGLPRGLPRGLPLLCSFVAPKIALGPSVRFAEFCRRSDVWADVLRAAHVPRCPALLH